MRLISCDSPDLSTIYCIHGIPTTPSISSRDPLGATSFSLLSLIPFVRAHTTKRNTTLQTRHGVKITVYRQRELRRRVDLHSAAKGRSRTLIPFGVSDEFNKVAVGHGTRSDDVWSRTRNLTLTRITGRAAWQERSHVAVRHPAATTWRDRGDDKRR